MKMISYMQDISVSLGISLLMFIPLAGAFFEMDMSEVGFLYGISFIAVFLVMIIRPLADIFSGYPWIRQLVVLRKGFGILSASIIVGFMIKKIITPDAGYLTSMFSMDFFAFKDYMFFAHVGDITGAILLATSNTFSQRMLRGDWKTVQRLSYAYFYSGGIYEAFFLQSVFALYALFIVTGLTLLAWAMNIFRKRSYLALG